MRNRDSDTQLLTMHVDAIICLYEFVGANGRNMRAFEDAFNKHLNDPEENELPKRSTTVGLEI